MTTASPLPRAAATVAATLSYLTPGQPTPRSYACPPPPGVPWESAAFEDRRVDIADARQHDHGTSLDAEGFALWDAPSDVRDFDDREAVLSTYYRECCALALAATGAASAHVFDHLLRRRDARAPLDFGRALAGRAGANGRVHNDYTEASGQRRLALVLTDERLRNAVQRFAIVNIWRSVRGPVLDTPLAVCDARTVRAADLVAAEVVYPQRTGAIYFVTPSPAHRSHYHAAMDRHEALVFKQYDTREDVARFTPHAAFAHPQAPAGTPPRESIEVRCLVVYR